MEKQKEKLEEKDVVNTSPSEDVQSESELHENEEIKTEEVEEKVDETIEDVVVAEPKSTDSEGEEVVEEDTKVEAEVVEAVEDTKSETEQIEVIEEVKSETEKASELQSEESSSEENTEEEEEESHEEEEHIDFEEFDKKQLVDFIVALKNEDNMRRVDRLLKQLRPRFDEIYQEEREGALNEFLKGEGNTEEDFDFRGDELDERFNDYYSLLKDRRNQYFRDLENQKEGNLKKKEEILDKIRDLVDGEESTISIKAIRALQDEWKAVGPVPPAQNRTLWANYHALLDRFYDARSIYFELKELDRKKNYDQKVELCERAESLAQQENIKDAVIQLNELHEEYKHLGPVPADLQEDLWQRFKAASDAIYIRRKDFVDELKKELFSNLDKKNALVDKIKEFGDFASDRITEWNAKTKELLAVQKEWEAIGGLPKEKAKEVNKAFWSYFKQFFNSKNQFFKELESKQEENLELKKQLIEQAEAIKDSSEWDKTANALKKLQQQWRDVGPVPEKVKNEIYNQFKAACDHFFEQRRSQGKQAEQVYEENYKQKLAICDKLEALSKTEGIDLEEAYDLIDEYMELGFVPRKVIKKMHKRFDDVIALLTSSKGLSSEDQQELKIQLQVSRMKGSPNGNRKINRKEQAIRRKIQNLESDINTYKTNIEFFARSKTADKLKEEMNGKIDAAVEELDQLKKQLRLLKEA